MKSIGIITLLLLLSTANALAGIRISEIMYNPLGTDTGREWIEIYNAGNQSVDLTGWQLVENNLERPLTLYQGEMILPARMPAILCKDAIKFLADYPGFNGTLLTSTFASLVNSEGEELIILDSDGLESDKLLYNTSTSEGHSIETEDACAPDVSWTESAPGGSPGAVACYAAEIPTEPTEPAEPTEPNQVPEFPIWGIGLILAAGMVYSRRNGLFKN